MQDDRSVYYGVVGLVGPASLIERGVLLMLNESPLFQPLRVGRYELAHRVVMPPLTRMRAGVGNVPSEFAAAYYGQRATPGGLVIAEATQAGDGGQGNPRTPGIHSAEQVEGWRAVTDAVHAQGGVIFLQLWHTGRASHSSFRPDGGLPIAPSAIAIDGVAITADGQRVPYETPRALEINEIAGIVGEFGAAARNALAAGFDGVEVHGANGYLIEQFLRSSSNHRDDLYGGTVANRARLLLEITRAVVDVCGPDRVGVRLSPHGSFNDVSDNDPQRLYGYVFDQVAEIGVAYLSLIQARTDVGMDIETPQVDADLRARWPGALIVAGGFSADTAERAVASGAADAVAFGRHFIANPDLVERLRTGADLTPYDRSTFYGGGAQGYVDYPALEASA